MKNKLNQLYVALALLTLSTLNSQLSSAHAQGTAFTYQGRLQNGTNAVTGNFDLTFELFNASTGPSQVGLTLTNINVGVTNGVFTVLADFGAVYNGSAYWLQIGVRTNGGGTFTTLSPRQELTPTPYSITAENVTGAIPLAQLPAGLVTNNETGVTLDNVTVGGNLTLPSPATINAGGNSLLFDDSLNNFYAGPGAGILNGAGGANTGLGYQSLNNNTNGTNNTAIGYQSMNNNSNGAYNVAIGERALFQNTSGNDNVADGRHALENNVNGTDNTANGFNALLNNTNGSFNTAEGSGALNGLKYGSNNIALGYQAGNNYTGGASSNILIGHPGVSGDNNVTRIGNGQTQAYISGVINGDGSGLTNFSASQINGAISLAQLPSPVVTNNESGVTLDNVTVGGTLSLPLPSTISAGGNPLLYADGNNNFFAGQSAGNQSLTGSQNTGVGFEALNVITSGAFNTAEGDLALGGNTSGGNNTAVGFKALWKNANGGGSTALGANVLAFNTSGSNNTAAGLSALESNTTGSDNTGVGDGALQNNTGGLFNTALGYNAGLNITGSSNIDIGHPGVASDNMTIRIGSGQTQTYIAGVINGDGSGLSNILSATLINNPGTQNFFAGSGAGNQTATGTHNTGVGEGALSDISSGVYNTANGYFALANNNTGGNNTAVGIFALENNTNGTGNTALGADAMAFNTSGGDNAATGIGALEYNTTGSDNTATGPQALEYNTTGSYNTGTGAYALSAYNVSGDLTGSDNTADGAYALDSNENGIQNTGIGFEALSGNTSGSYNTAAGVGALVNNNASDNNAFGGDALAMNTIGTDNVAVGGLALFANTNGNNNTATGYGAMLFNDSGNDNTANGYFAMGGTSSSSAANTAIGGYAIYNITDGYNNTAVGYQALEGDSSGVDNLSLGVATLQSNSVGSANTACGTYSFQNLTSGSGNIGLGYSAGNTLVSGDNNIYIGNTGPANENNTIRIGTPGTQTATYLSGLVTMCAMTIAGGCDLAEPFPISPTKQEVSEGAVVVIDEANPGQLKLTSQPYDTRVAGVISGANGIHTGIQMHQEGLLDGGRNVALTGRVYVQADASNGPIRPGDLLTTSSAPGRAMKVTDHTRAQGAILGKAMTGLSEGNGLVLVLVTLQ